MTDWGTGRYEHTAAQLAPAAARAVEAADVQPGDRVLDLACGTGNAALLAAMRGAQVTGLDPAERLLDVAAGRARAAGVEVAWAPGVATELPFDDGAFDAVLSVFGVIFAAPAEDAVAELVRVTADGGRIVLTTWTDGGAIAAGSGVLMRAVVAATGASSTAGPAPRSWGDPDYVAGLFAPHGLVPQIERIPHVFEAASPDAFADEWLEQHPMWLAARPLLGDDGYAGLREPLIAALSAGNEDPAAFRVTSEALLIRIDRA
ncbi:MAG: methyltransferase domain-containing protein [Patulibacter sp.]|nr:methyltransferase domain-containing protein [Patulibacter sp.]